MLTTSLDDLTGTAGTDTFKATVKYNETIAAPNQDRGTAALGDAIDGGLGVDTVLISVLENQDNNANVGENTALQLTNVENVEVIDFANDNFVSAALWDGVEKVTLTGKTDDVGVVDLQNAVVMGVANMGDGNANFEYDTNAIGSDVATLQFEFSNIGNDDNNPAYVEANLSGNDAASGVEIAATGTNFVDLYIDNHAANGIETITVTGTGSLYLEANNNEDNNVVTFDASGNSGGVEIDLSDSNATLETLLGGSGDDTFTVDGTAADAEIDLGAGDDVLTAGAGDLDDIASVDGGEGADTITLDAMSLATKDKFSNFEIADLAGANGTIDVSLFTKNTFSSLANTGAIGAGGVTVQNLAGTAINLAVGANTTNAITATLKDSSGAADTAAINFDAESTGFTVASLTVTGVETITINSDGDLSGTNVVSDLIVTGDTLTKITITGANDFTLTDVDVNTGGTATAATTVVTKLTTIDASAATGVVTITAGGSDTATDTDVTNSYKGLTIKSGSGNDVITNNAADGVVEAGAGTDTVTVNATGQTIDVGVDEDADLVDFATAANIGFADTGAFTVSTKVTTIKNIAAGDDIDLSAIAGGAASAIVDYTTTAETFNSLVDAVNGALAVGSDALYSFEWVDGNTYIVADGDTANFHTVVKLIGVDYDLSAASGIITAA